MKDLKDIDIKSGDKVHIFGNSIKDGNSIDINAIVLNTRGRGIKFVDEVTSKEYTQDFIKEHGYIINILEQRIVKSSTGEKKRSITGNRVVQDELDLIEKLKGYGWYGIIYKTADDTKFTITLPEYENRNR